MVSARRVGMPHYMEHGARVSDGWSLGGSATVELPDFTRKPTEDPMTEENLTLVELLQKSGDGDFLKSVANVIAAYSGSTTSAPSPWSHRCRLC